MKIKEYRKRTTSSSIISSAITLIMFTSTAHASAATAGTLEKCAGVVKAGVNDCASNEHVCAGLNTDNGNDEDWIWLPQGTCDKIYDGRIIGTNKKGIDKAII